MGVGKEVMSAMKRRIVKFAGMLVLTAAALFALTPLLFLFTGTFMGTAEIQEYAGPVLLGKEGYAGWRMIPQYPTLKNIVELLFDSPEYFHMFWNTVKISCGVLIGQMIFGMPGAWGLARYSFPGKGLIYRLYILFMMMPFQVMMLSEYLVLEKIGINNTLWAVIVPGVFSTFSVFLMYRFFSDLPEEILEAARIDGAGEWQIFWHIGLPLGSAGVCSALILQFLECFSMIEQPIAFLKDKSLWPLSLYLPELNVKESGFAMCASLVTLLAALLVFINGKDYIEQGIVASALKE